MAHDVCIRDQGARLLVELNPLDPVQELAADARPKGANLIDDLLVGDLLVYARDVAPAMAACHALGRLGAAPDDGLTVVRGQGGDTVEELLRLLEAGVYPCGVLLVDLLVLLGTLDEKAQQACLGLP